MSCVGRVTCSRNDPAPLQTPSNSRRHNQATDSSFQNSDFARRVRRPRCSFDGDRLCSQGPLEIAHDSPEMIEAQFRVPCGLADECASRLTNRTLTTIGLHIISVIVFFTMN